MPEQIESKAVDIVRIQTHDNHSFLRPDHSYVLAWPLKMLEIELFENLWEANLDAETTSNTRISFPTPPRMGIHFFSISHSVKSVHQVDRATEAK